VKASTVIVRTSRLLVRFFSMFAVSSRDAVAAAIVITLIPELEWYVRINAIVFGCASA